MQMLIPMFVCSVSVPVPHRFTISSAVSLPVACLSDACCFCQLSCSERRDLHDFDIGMAIAITVTVSHVCPFVRLSASPPVRK